MQVHVIRYQNFDTHQYTSNIKRISERTGRKWARKKYCFVHTDDVGRHLFQFAICSRTISKLHSDRAVQYYNSSAIVLGLLR